MRLVKCWEELGLVWSGAGDEAGLCIVPMAV